MAKRKAPPFNDAITEALLGLRRAQRRIERLRRRAERLGHEPEAATLRDLDDALHGLGFSAALALKTDVPESPIGRDYLAEAAETSRAMLDNAEGWYVSADCRVLPPEMFGIPMLESWRRAATGDGHARSTHEERQAVFEAHGWRGGARRWESLDVVDAIGSVLGSNNVSTRDSAWIIVHCILSMGSELRDELVGAVEPSTSGTAEAVEIAACALEKKIDRVDRGSVLDVFQTVKLVLRALEVDSEFVKRLDDQAKKRRMRSAEAQNDALVNGVGTAPPLVPVGFFLLHC